jgi:hypothetical protein
MGPIESSGGCWIDSWQRASVSWRHASVCSRAVWKGSERGGTEEKSQLWGLAEVPAVQ